METLKTSLEQHVHLDRNPFFSRQDLSQKQENFPTDNLNQRSNIPSVFMNRFTNQNFKANKQNQGMSKTQRHFRKRSKLSIITYSLID